MQFRVLQAVFRKCVFLIVFEIVAITAGSATAQVPNSSDGLVGDWVFWPNYMLSGSGANYPGPKIDKPTGPALVAETVPLPLTFRSQEPTDRVRNLIPPDKLPKGPFTVELWISNHVTNKDIGSLVTVKGRNVDDAPAWILSSWRYKARFELRTKDQKELLAIDVPLKHDGGFKRYWWHLVGVFDGQKTRLYVNGSPTDGPTASGEVLTLSSPEFEIASYLKNEPYMEMSNLVKSVRVYDRAVTEKEVTDRFQSLCQMVEDGKLFADLFHFNEGPYLHFSQPTSMNLTWETDRPSIGVIEYGQGKELDHKLEFSEPRTLHEATIPGLEPETQYFYRVRAISGSGETIDSGRLTFKTAVKVSSPYAFAIIGDTESRPHINNRLCQLIWNERPDFLLNCGDLTDAGKKSNKFQWNMEYFVGMTALTSRIPLLPVAGNGEDDYYWYTRYHKLPDPELYYSYKFGNAEFFILNSNERETEFGPGGKQYEWLDKALQASTATWKFAAHHHPTYTSDEDDYGNRWQGKSNLGDLNVRQLAELYEKHKVDIVFFGHLHSYERTWPIQRNLTDVKHGVIYVQSGGGGGNTEGFGPTRTWFSNRTHSGTHYCMVTINGPELAFKMYDTESRMLDHFQLDKSDKRD